MILEDKKQIRKNIKNVLASYKENFEKDSIIITELILQSPEYINADTILSYMALPDEVFLDNKKFSSKNVFIPKVHQEDGEMDFYKFDENTLESGAYDILEPTENNKFILNAPEKYGNVLVLVPGRAFTIQGHRLGRGKGYYDKYLEKLTGNVSFVGVCFKPQIMEKLPTDKYDILMDKIITTK